MFFFSSRILFYLSQKYIPYYIYHLIGPRVLISNLAQKGTTFKPDTDRYVYPTLNSEKKKIIHIRELIWINLGNQIYFVVTQVCRG